MDMDYSLLYSIDSNTWSDSAVNGAVDKVSKEGGSAISKISVFPMKTYDSNVVVLIM